MWFLIRRRAWWADLKIFFATMLGIMHRVARRVSVSFCQLFLKRFLKMPESGTDPATVRFEVERRCTSILTVAQGFVTPRVGSIPAATILLPHGFESRFEHFYAFLKNV